MSRKRQKATCKTTLATVATLMGLGAITFAADGSGVRFPDGYRQWTVAKFRFESKGALRYHYANAQAFATWGQFSDGSIIVDEKVHAKLGDDGTWREEAIAHVAVMRKDAKAHAETGGWYFNFFAGDDRTAGLTPEQAKARCFDACHKAQEARDFVFSDPRR